MSSIEWLIASIVCSALICYASVYLTRWRRGRSGNEIIARSLAGAFLGVFCGALLAAAFPMLSGPYIEHITEITFGVLGGVSLNLFEGIGNNFFPLD